MCICISSYKLSSLSVYQNRFQAWSVLSSNIQTKITSLALPALDVIGKAEAHFNISYVSPNRILGNHCQTHTHSLCVFSTVRNKETAILFFYARLSLCIEKIQRWSRHIFINTKFSMETKDINDCEALVHDHYFFLM